MEPKNSPDSTLLEFHKRRDHVGKSSAIITMGEDNYIEVHAGIWHARSTKPVSAPLNSFAVKTTWDFFRDGEPVATSETGKEVSAFDIRDSLITNAALEGFSERKRNRLGALLLEA